MSLDEQVAMYLEYTAARNTESTLAAYTHRLARFQRFIHGRRVTKELVRLWYIDMKREGLSNSTIVWCRRAVRAMYNYMLENEIIASNPVVRVEDATPVQVIRPVITLEEQKRILVKADSCDDEEVWPYAVRCGWETGLRISDVSLLRWSSIKWEERGISTIPLKTKRFGKIVEVPIGDEFFDWLRASWLKQGQPEFGFVSERMASLYQASESATSSLFVRLAARAKVFKSFHSYRHSRISRWIAQGVSPAIISTCSGQTVEQVMSYCHLTLSDKRAAMGLSPINPPNAVNL